MNVVINVLGKSSMTPGSLKAATGLDFHEFILAVVEAGPKLRVDAASGTIEVARRGRPKGRSNKVVDRIEAAKAAILELRGGGATVADVVARLGDNAAARDVKAAAIELAAAGELSSRKKGRAVVFFAPVGE